MLGVILNGTLKPSPDSDKDWTHQTGDAAAHNLVVVARALRANPIPKPPNA